MQSVNRSRWFLHPVFIFVFSSVALVASLFLYIYWYMEISTALENLVQKFNIDPGLLLLSQTGMVVLVLSGLVGIILTGIVMTFLYYQKTLKLYRLQHNFINNFTHELKTPVTSLKLYLETFLKHRLSQEDQEKYIHYMIQDVTRLTDNINSILNLARIESRNYEGELVPADLVAIVKGFVDSDGHLFRNCDIAVNNPSNTPFVYRINRPLLEMLFMNLFTNAVKYNRSDRPKITIDFLPQRRKLFIRISDNGIGLAREELKKIFRKFYQVGRSDIMSSSGSGLGLYLVENIARIHKWKVKATSDGPGCGSAFTFVLPLFPAEPPPSPTQPDEGE